MIKARRRKGVTIKKLFFFFAVRIKAACGAERSLNRNKKLVVHREKNIHFNAGRGKIRYTGAGGGNAVEKIISWKKKRGMGIMKLRFHFSFLFSSLLLFLFFVYSRNIRVFLPNRGRKLSFKFLSVEVERVLLRVLYVRVRGEGGGRI